jgi:hypothetical protein
MGSIIMSDELNDAIRAVSMLVSYHTSSPSFSIKDEDAAKAAAKAAGADVEAYRAVKNLLVGNDKALTKVTAVLEKGRRTHKHFTLPWTIDDSKSGPRLLPTATWLPYMQAIAKINTEFNESVTAFVTSYPTDVAAAQKRLNLTGNLGTLYPPQSELRSLFSMSVDFTPIPAGAAFQGLPEGVPAQLEQSYERRLQQRVKSAVKDSLSRAREPMQALYERLNVAPENLSFRQPTVDAVIELPRLLRAWNVIGDDRITTLAADIEQIMKGETAQILRTNDSDRAIVMAGLKELLTVINEIEGDF